MRRLNCKSEKPVEETQDAQVPEQEQEQEPEPEQKQNKSEPERQETMYTDFESSNIDGMAYKVDRKQLYIRFKDGSVYVYLHVPMQVAQRLYKARSKGRYFWKKIRNNPKFKYKKLN